MKKQHLIALMVMVTLLVATQRATFSQTSSLANTKQGSLTANAVKDIYFNTGLLCDGGDGVFPSAAWPVALNSYIFDLDFVVALQKVFQDTVLYSGNSLSSTTGIRIRDNQFININPQTIVYNFILNGQNAAFISDTATYVTSHPSPRGNKKNTFGSSFWGLAPQTTSINPTQSYALTLRNPPSWPASWNGQWKGINGDGTSVADDEGYYALDDSNDEQLAVMYSYFPFPNDKTRAGAGLRITGRALQFTDPLANNAIYWIYDVQNQSSQTYTHMILGTVVGTAVGGQGYTQYNITGYDSSRALAYTYQDNPLHVGLTWDKSYPAGTVATQYLQTPDNRGMTSYYFGPASSIVLSNVQAMWNILTPSQYTPVNLAPQDEDYAIGTGYFSLAPNETKRLVLVLVYGSNSNWQLNADRADLFYKSNFGTTKQGKIQLTSLRGGSTVSGTTPITWTTSGVAPTAKVGIYYSTNAGRGWALLQDSLSAGTGTYSWNTTNQPDGAFYKIRVTLEDLNAQDLDFSDATFTVKNTNNGTPTILVSHTIDSLAFAPVVQGNVTLAWTGKDPQGDVCTVKIENQYDGQNWATLAQGLPATGTYIWNTTGLPNGNLNKLRYTISNGVTSSQDTTLRVFTLQNPRTVLATGKNLLHLQGTSSASVTGSISTASATNNHRYRIAFDVPPVNGVKQYRIFDETANQSVYSSLPIPPSGSQLESPEFGGLRIQLSDVTLGLDNSKSGLKTTTGATQPISIGSARSIGWGFDYPSNYEVVFSNTNIDTSDALTFYYPQTQSNVTVSQRYPVKFTIKNLKYNRRTQFVFGSTNHSDSSETICLVETDSLGRNELTWMFYRGGNPGTTTQLPTLGDTLFIVVNQPFTIDDVYRISVNDITGVKTSEPLPMQFKLSQNYPNPFNPTTTIRYAVPSQQWVKLKIYDVLGREVATLVNERKAAGSYEVKFDASRLASGMYLYKLQAGSYTETKKMMLVK